MYTPDTAMENLQSALQTRWPTFVITVVHHEEFLGDEQWRLNMGASKVVVKRKSDGKIQVWGPIDRNTLECSTLGLATDISWRIRDTFGAT